MRWTFFLCCLFLVACAQQPPSSGVESDHGTNLTNEELLANAEQIILDLFESTFTDEINGIPIADVYSLEEREFQQAIQIQYELLSNYATKSFIEENIPLNIAGCEEQCLKNVPTTLTLTWDTTVTDVTNKSFKVQSIAPPYSNVYAYDEHSYLQIVTFKKEDTVWKVDALKYKKKDMHLTEQQVRIYLEQQGYNVNQLTHAVQTIGDLEEDVYIFSDVANTRHSIIARTGAISLYEEDGSSDFSISNEEQYIDYILFNDWHLEEAHVKALVDEKSLQYVALANNAHNDIVTYYAEQNRKALQKVVDAQYVALESMLDYYGISEQKSASLLQDEQLWNYYKTLYMEQYEQASSLEKAYIEASIVNNFLHYILSNEAY